MIEVSRRFGPVAMGLLFLAIALVLWGETFRDSYHLSRASHATGPAFYPRIVLAGMILLSVLVIADAIRKERGSVKLEGVKPVLGLVAITVAYGIAIFSIGFLVASFLYIVAVSVALGYRRLPVIVPVAAAYAVAVWFVFQEVLLIILPASPWFETF